MKLLLACILSLSFAGCIIEDSDHGHRRHDGPGHQQMHNPPHQNNGGHQPHGGNPPPPPPPRR